MYTKTNKQIKRKEKKKVKRIVFNKFKIKAGQIFAYC